MVVCRAWGPAVLLMVLIFVSSSLPNPPDAPGGLSDVGAHAIVYGVLAVLILRGLANARWRDVTFALGWVAVVLSGLYGASDEFHQSFVENRVADVNDLIADILGAFVGIALVWGWGIVLSLR